MRDKKKGEIFYWFNFYPINQTIEDRLQADTMKEFISYAVGCMFGRYWLDIKGLILANAGDCIEQYIKMVPEPSIAAGTKEKIQAQRDVDRFEKALLEISEWDASVLRPLALKRIERCA